MNSEEIKNRVIDYTRDYKNRVRQRSLILDTLVAAQAKLTEQAAELERLRQQPNPALAALQYALGGEFGGIDDAEHFLRAWMEGDFDGCREWAEDKPIPDEVFIGADPLFKPEPPK